jgi:hypothetical protein
MTNFTNLPTNIEKIIYNHKILTAANQLTLKRTSKCMFPSTHCKNPSQKQIAQYHLPNNMKGYKGALERIKGGDTSSNAFAAAVPNIYKKLLFPGYGGHQNARSFFSNYNNSQRVPRYTTLMKRGNKLYTADLRKKVHILFS